MNIKSIVPKLGNEMHYLGKPVKDENGTRIGSITEVKSVDDNYELIMCIDDKIARSLCGSYSSVSFKFPEEPSRCNVDFKLVDRLEASDDQHEKISKSCTGCFYNDCGKCVTPGHRGVDVDGYLICYTKYIRSE